MILNSIVQQKRTMKSLTETLNFIKKSLPSPRFFFQVKILYQIHLVFACAK